MRFFANLFLILFVADGGFSLVDEFVVLFSPLEPFTDLRVLLGGTVVAMAVTLYICLGIDQRLPKRVFLPLIFFVFFGTLSTWFFPALAGIRIYGFLMAAAQILLGSLPLRYFRTENERSLTMPPEMFTVPFFNLKKTLIFSAASLVVVPMVLLLSLLAMADAYVAEGTAGFMRIGPGGLHMTEKVYRRDNRTVRLAAMIHVGDKEYYDTLADSMVARRAIILAEGVSDTGSKLVDRIDYGKVAGFLGLTSQHEMRFRGRLIDEKELEAPLPLVTDGKQQARGADILRADVDISEFRPPTLLFLNAFGKQLRESSSFVKGLMALNAWGEKNLTPEMQDLIMDDILHRRNIAVVSRLDKALARYDTVVIPWGALHMKEIEAEILKRGFKLQEKKERVSIHFGKILLGLMR